MLTLYKTKEVLLNVKFHISSISLYGQFVDFTKQLLIDINSVTVGMDKFIPSSSRNSDSSTESIKNIDQQILCILRTVLERCKKEKSNNFLQVPLEECHERVSFYTGYPKMFIYHVVDDGNPLVEDSFDDKDHILLMQCINNFLKKKYYLKITDLFQEFLKCRSQTTNVQQPLDYKTFEKKLFQYGYVYKKNLTQPPLVLIENPKLKFERFNYLFKIKDYRNKERPIYYVSEKHICRNGIRSIAKATFDSGKQLLDEGLIFFHLISAIDYEYGMFVSNSSDSLEETFKKWMTEIVLYKIKPNSVIVMENNFIHGMLPRKSITRYHPKKHMLNWLRENNIPCDDNMQKPRLYELIEKCTVNNEDYDIDRVFKLHGHSLLRLPTTFTSLTPIKLLWDFLEDKLSKRVNPGIAKENLLKYLTIMEKSNWLKFMERVVYMENQIFEIDLVTENLLENNYELDEKCFYETSPYFNLEDIIENI